MRTCAPFGQARAGEVRQAYELLALIYGWFTEGFDTLPLRGLTHYRLSAGAPATSGFGTLRSSQLLFLTAVGGQADIRSSWRDFALCPRANVERDEVNDLGVVEAVGSFLPAAIRIPRVLLPHNVELRLLLVA
jgi:hypothetical protein